MHNGVHLLNDTGKNGIFLKRFYLLIFRERGREKEREGEKHQCVVASCAPLQGTWPATQARALMGNRTANPLVCQPALNPLSHTSQVKMVNFMLGISLPAPPAPHTEDAHIVEFTVDFQKCES